jgi:hypothetical protein
LRFGVFEGCREHPTAPRTADKHREDRQGTHANAPKPAFRQLRVLYKKSRSVYDTVQDAISCTSNLDVANPSAPFSPTGRLVSLASHILAMCLKQ